MNIDSFLSSFYSHVSTSSRNISSPGYDGRAITLRHRENPSNFPRASWSRADQFFFIVENLAPRGAKAVVIKKLPFSRSNLTRLLNFLSRPFSKGSNQRATHYPNNIFPPSLCRKSFLLSLLPESLRESLQTLFLLKRIISMLQSE